MAREWLNSAFRDLHALRSFSAIILLIVTSASAFTPPSTTGSSFLGAAIDKDGIFSLLFSNSNYGQKDSGPFMSNSLFSTKAGREIDYLRHTDGIFHAARNIFQTEGSSVTSDGSQVQWDVENFGVVKVTVTFSATVQQDTYGVSFAFAGSPHFYGVWEYPWDKAITNNHYGANLTANTAEERNKSLPTADIGIYGTQPGINWSNARAPFFFADNGLGVYVDSDTPVTYKFQEGQGSTNVTIGVSAGAITYRVLYDQTSIKALLGEFAQLSSYPLLPTESAYGPIFWSDDFEQDFHDSSIKNSQDNINDVANHLDEFRIRATSFFADRPYGSGNWSFGNFDFDHRFYPSPAAFIANLTKRGYDFQVWVANRAFLYTQLFNDSSTNNWLFPGIDPVQFLGPALNLSIPAAYDYYSAKLVDFVSKMGIRGFKIDRGEEREMPDSEQNRQQNLFLTLCDEVMKKVWGGSNASTSFPAPYYNFARSAFDRDRSRVGIWNGDSEATFEGLQYTVASGIRAGLLGFSHWGSDTGGYVRDAGGPSEELFARWMHFSAWTPMYEIMIGLNHTPWYQYSPRLVNVLRQTADTHTRLIPYLRTYGYDASKTGVPVIRALFLEFPDDRDAYTTGDAYMLGSDFLVAPVLTEGGNRTVRFPKVSNTTTCRKFLEYENKTAVFSPGDIHEVVQLPIESMPVYVREGSLVPTGNVYQGNSVGWARKNDSAWAPHIVLEAFPSFDVPETVISYYRGREAVTPPGIPAGAVAIYMTTHHANRTVTFRATDSLGVNASVVVYQKSVKDGKLFSVTLDFPMHNQTAVYTGLYSLFE
ncbi:hypothetical protein SEUCBS140593_009354 [Sporothrix eucalyptigena]|uniref:Glycoside hydrolase family 31 protein n=1 Tax=Sporothrix eucalyptigena TaxID=1812306 RepID=A0ABP0CUT4_9PEZI